MRYKAVLSLLGYLIVLSYVSWWQVVDFVLSECMWLVFYNLFQCQVQQNSLCWSRHVSPTKRQENGKQRDASGLAGVDYQEKVYPHLFHFQLKLTWMLINWTNSLRHLPDRYTKLCPKLITDQSNYPSLAAIKTMVESTLITRNTP